MSFHCAAQRNAELVSAAPPVEDVTSHIKTIERPVSTTAPFEDAQRDVLPIGFTSEPSLKNGVSLTWVRNAWKSTDFRVARMKKKYSSKAAFLQASMIPVPRREYFYILMGDLQTVRCIAWYRATYNNLLGLFPESKNSSVSKRAILCVKGSIRVSFFLSKNKEIMYCGLAFM